MQGAFLFYDKYLSLGLSWSETVMGLVLCSIWDWEEMQKPGMMRSCLGTKYDREVFL